MVNGTPHLPGESSPGATENAPGKKNGYRLDGYMNLLASRGHYGGVPYGPQNRMYSNMDRYWNITGDTYEELYLSRGVATTIIDRPADDCFANGFGIEGDDDDLMEDELDRLSVSSKFADAVRWARLFGASAVAILAKDGGSWDTPLNLDSLDTVEDLQIYDVRHIQPTDRLYTDPTSPKFGKPEWFKISPPGGTPFDIHDLRLIPFSGDPIPISSRNQSTVWWYGKPILQSCVIDIERLEAAWKWALKLLERKQQGIYKMEGLGELFAQNLDGLVSKRVDLVDTVRGNLNSVVVDALDEYRIENLGLDNVQNVIIEYEVAVCASSRMPNVILFGKSTTGLNNTGSGDLSNYYGMIGLIQSRIAQPALEQLISILWLQKGLKSSIPDTWQIEWEPLWEPSAQEQAQANLTEAQAKNTEITALIQLLNAGVLLPEEIRKIVANKYEEYQLDDSLDSLGGDEVYAQSVGGGDTTEPAATNTPANQTTQAPGEA